MSYELLASPMKIGSCEIKNRVVMPPMLMGFANLDGTPTEQLIAYYEERAKGGTGLIMTEITRVNDMTGSAAFAQLAVSHDYHIKPLSRLAERIHLHGAKIFVQLHHPGRQNVGLLVGTVPMSIALEKLTRGIYSKLLYKITPTAGSYLIKNNIVPPSVAPSHCETAYFAGGHVRALTHREIKQLEGQFIDGAVRVKKAGCDGVELHSAHGYLLQQFLSPVTNQRTDEYGGTLENRMRFILNIIHGIKEKCGNDFPVIVRLSADECYEMIGQHGKGYTLSDGVEIAKILEKNGVDAIDVSSAGYDTFNYWLEPVSFEPGWRKYMAKAVKQAVSVPVLAANLIRSPEQAQSQIEEGCQDFVCLGRPHIADPHWANKAFSGGNIRRCICCLNCIESMQENAYIGSHGECSLNPFVGREKEELIKNGNNRRIAVVGAGPAGLTCAYILAERGFKVTVFEKNTAPGGQLILAASPPEKGKTAWAIEDMVKQCEIDGVEIRLGTPASVENITALRPAGVICASGADPIKPKFGGDYDESFVCTFDDILTGRIKFENKKIAVVGSGMTGLETSQALTENKNSVTVIEMADEIAPGTWMQHKDDILPKLEKAGVVFMTGEKLSEIGRGFAVTENVSSGEKTKIDCDAVVLALGSRSDKSIVKALTGAGLNPISIGDCVKPGKIADAVKGAYFAAVKLIDEVIC